MLKHGNVSVSTVSISSSLALLSSKIKALTFLASPSSCQREIDYLLRPASPLTVQQQPPTNIVINMVKCLWRVPVESNSLSHPSPARINISKRLPLLRQMLGCPYEQHPVQTWDFRLRLMNLQTTHFTSNSCSEGARGGCKCVSVLFQHTEPLTCMCLSKQMLCSLVNVLKAWSVSCCLK